MTYTGIASTTDVDLDKDRIISWDMEPGQKYKKPMFWQHDTYAAPVADGDVWVDIDPDTNAPVLLISFDMYDTDEAEALTTAINNGAITSLSVGFSVSQENYAPNEDGGYNFWNAHLTEVSIVLNPANPNAIIDRKMVASKSEEGKKDIFVKMSTSFAAKTITKSLDKPAGEPDPKADAPSTEKASSEPDETRVTDDQEKKSADQEPNEVESLQKMVDELKKSLEDLKSVAKSEKDDTMETKNKDAENADTHVSEKFKSVSETNKHKEPTKMAKQHSEVALFNAIQKSISEKVGHKMNTSLSEVIKSIDLPDNFQPEDVQQIIDRESNKPQDDYLALLPAVAPFRTNKTFVGDVTADEAGALSRTAGVKIEQVYKLLSREPVEGEIYTLQGLDFKTLAEDTEGKVLQYVYGKLQDKFNEAVATQILTGNARLTDKTVNPKADVNLDDKLIPITKDVSLYTTQFPLKDLSLDKVAAGIETITSDGDIVAVMNRKTLGKLKREKGSDGHYVLPTLTAEAVAENIGVAKVLVVNKLPDNQIVAHDISSYQRFSVTNGSVLKENYDISVNRQLIERVGLMGGSLVKPASAVNITVDASDPASL